MHPGLGLNKLNALRSPGPRARTCTRPRAPHAHTAQAPPPRFERMHRAGNKRAPEMRAKEFAALTATVCLFCDTQNL